MASSAVSNPPPPTESKSSKKKKARATEAASSSVAGSVTPSTDAKDKELGIDANGVGADGGEGSPYVKELMKLVLCEV